jgi:hypothetical protein
MPHTRPHISVWLLFCVDDFSSLVCGRWLILKHGYVCYHLMQSLGEYFKLGSHWAGNSNIQKLELIIGSKRQDDSPFSFVTLPVTLCHIVTDP